jgi:hypothetical protein
MKLAKKKINFIKYQKIFALIKYLFHLFAVLKNFANWVQIGFV